MSASREKKQRQGSGPSEKSLQAQQQQAARKRKTITYTAIGVVVAALIAALLIWDSGFFQARATAATVGSTNLSAAELSFYYYNTRYQYVSYMSYFGGYDSTKSDAEQAHPSDENRTLRDYFLESALSNAQQTQLLYDEAVKNGHTDAEVKETLDAYIANAKASASASGYGYAAYLRARYGPYVTPAVYEKVMRMSLVGDLAGQDKQTELSEGYTEADLKAYYDKDENANTYDTFEYSFLYFTPETVETKDKDGNDIDEEEVNTKKELALAAAKTEADEALEAVKDGDKIADLAKKYDLIDANFGDHVTVVGSNRIASALQDKLVDMKDGDTAVVENGESGYYVLVSHGRYLDDTPTRDVRHILARAEHTTGDDNKLVPPTDEAWAAAKEKIDAIVAEYEGGDKTEDSFAKLANEKSDDGDGTTGGLYPKIDPSDSYVPEFLDWIFEDGRKPGDTGVVQHSATEGSTSGYYGYHFIYLVGDNEPLWMRQVRSALTEQDTNAWLDELAKNYETALTGGADSIGR